MWVRAYTWRKPNAMWDGMVWFLPLVCPVRYQRHAYERAQDRIVDKMRARKRARAFQPNPNTMLERILDRQFDRTFGPTPAQIAKYPFRARAPYILEAKRIAAHRK